MARELTKLHEEVVRGPLGELSAEIGARESLKGEVVLLVGPPARGAARAVAVATDADASVPIAAADAAPDAETVRARVAELVAGGAKRTHAVKQVAAETGLARNVVYDLCARR